MPAAGRATACRHVGCMPLLLIHQSLAFPHASPYPATARLRSIARQPIAAIAAVHEYLPVCTRAYAHALCAATESETSNFDHEQIGTMGWQCAQCNIQVEYQSADTSKCAVSHNCLRTRAILTLCKILHSSYCMYCFFLRRMCAFLDNTSLFFSSLFYSCSFVDVVFVATLAFFVT
jgi:hypothetical protein